MKKIFSHISNSTFLALAFFGLMTFVGIATAHAQNDTVNPLISTTGPNVLPAGGIQWKNQFGFFSNSYDGLSLSTNQLCLQNHR